MKFIIHRNELAAALLFSSNDESRFILNSIRFELRPNCAPIVVSCDGRRLAVIETIAVQSLDEKPLEFAEHSFTLEKSFAKAFIQLSRACSSKLFPLLCIEQTPGSKRITVTHLAPKAVLEIESGALIEGEYPNWRQVIPARSVERSPVNEVGINADFVADYGKVGKLLGAETRAVQFSLVGPDAAIEARIPSLDQFYGLVMPTKIQATKYQPEFLMLDKAA